MPADAAAVPAAVAPVRSAHELERLRRRTVGVLVAGVALGSTGHIAALTVATIVAEDMTGSAALAGAPGAAVVLGAAAGAGLLSWVMARRGRRWGLAGGYVIGVVGALVAVASIVAGAVAGLLVGTFLVGFGNASNQLSRYAAADMYPAARRASALGVVVWGATVGAVVGPNLVEPAGRVAVGLGLPETSGAYLVPIAFVGIAALLSFVGLRPDPFELADPGSTPAADAPADARLRALLTRPAVLTAIVALVVGQAVMVLIMTMTPLHMRQHGHDLAAVGLVLSAHTFGMFALSPISGRLTDRFGSVPVVVAGTAVLAVAAVLSAAAPPDGGPILAFALFLLGYGWNLGFVAGSALLTGGLSIGERTRIQGLTDGLIWGTATFASLGSGVVLEVAGYTTLGLLGAAMVALPVWVVASRRRALGVRGA